MHHAVRTHELEGHVAHNIQARVLSPGLAWAHHTTGGGPLGQLSLVVSLACMSSLSQHTVEGSLFLDSIQSLDTCRANKW